MGTDRMKAKVKIESDKALRWWWGGGGLFKSQYSNAGKTRQGMSESNCWAGARNARPSGRRRRRELK